VAWQVMRGLSLALALALMFLAAAPALAVSPAVPVPGMVTMVDLGAKACIPCKMMAPILVELEKEYKGKAAVVFIDVREDYDAAKKFGIRSIPTQIFYDKKGREVARHEGFLDKKSIADQLNKLLAK
jgi:thioredoxin 1